MTDTKEINQVSEQSYNGYASQHLKSTTDYSQFKIDTTNRPVDWDHVEEIYDAIERKNLLHLFPIIVSTDDHVRDGQHRLKAAEALGVPIYYFVSDDMSIHDVARVTARVNGWTTLDYLHHYCARGYQDYIKLREFLDEFSFVSATMGYHLCQYGTWKHLAQKFKDGEWVCNDIPFARKVALAALDFKNAGCNFYGHRSFVDAIGNLMANARYDHGRMKDKLEYLSYKVVKCPDMPTYIEMLSDIYNYKVRNPVRLERLKPGHPGYRVDRRPSVKSEDDEDTENSAP